MGETRYYVAVFRQQQNVWNSEYGYFGGSQQIGETLYKQVERLPEEVPTDSAYHRVRFHNEVFVVDGLEFPSVGQSTTRWQNGRIDYVLAGICSEEQYAIVEKAGWLTDKEIDPAA